jgi:hypothetical protein
MTFKTPSPALYLISLIIAAVLAGVAYWILGAQGLIENSLFALIAGLVIGHLVGVCAIPTTGASTASSPTTRPTRAAPNHSTPANASNGAITSLYVGNLAYNAQRDALRQLFEQYGAVSSVRIMTDRATRRPRGYGFVEMDASAAHVALAQLDNTEFCGRTLRVSEAKQRQE